LWLRAQDVVSFSCPISCSINIRKFNAKKIVSVGTQGCYLNGGKEGEAIQLMTTLLMLMLLLLVVVVLMIQMLNLATQRMLMQQMLTLALPQLQYLKLMLLVVTWNH
jgi:hypothetical protein